MSEFARPPKGFPFAFLGMKTNLRADLLPPGKYPIAINIRGYTESRVEGRPGMPQFFQCASSAPWGVTDMRGYINPLAVNPNQSRILARTQGDAIYLDTGVKVGSLNPSSTQGATLIPFRPGASPQPWMYIANGSDYQKFSAPSTLGVVTQARVGIAEPQAAPDAAIIQNFQGLIGGFASSSGGTAGSPSNGNRVNDTAGTVLQDPTGAAEWTVQVGAASSYQKLMEVTIGTNVFMVVDVFASLPSSITIQSIFYFSGTTGHCVIIPQTISGETGEDQSVFQTAFLSTLRRGAMLVVGSEKCYVWSVSSGPDGSISIETFTTGAHTTSDALTTLPAISVIPSAPVKFATAATPAGSNTYSGFSSGGQQWAGSPSVVAAMAALDGNFATVPLVTTGPPFPPFASGLMALQNFGFAIPAAATILGVAATIYAKASPANGQTFFLNTLLLKAGVISGHPTTASGSSILQAATTPLTYGSAADLWATTLTPADVNNTGFGITIQVTNNDGNTTVSVDWVNIVVYYFLPAGGGPLPTPVGGQPITDPDITYQVATGIGTMTNTTGSNPFNIAGASFQPEDYISLGIKVDTLANLTEMKFLLDVGDGSFTQNFYYYTIRPSDIATAVANSATQLATSQTVAQRATVDAEVAAIDAQAGFIDTTSGTQLLPGSSQWTEVVFPISALTRVGNDQTKSLQTLVKIQYLWNASGTINVATDLPFVFGGFQADVGDIGAPLQYRVRPRSQATGVVGNPSPESRYGVNPRRGQVTVYLPSASYDPQIDTWDVFRYGGAVTEWRFVGSTPSGSATFTDNFDDAAAEAGDALDFDNFEPWPSVDVPNNGTATTVNGTVLVLNSTNANITRYLPGTLIQIGGQNVYTFYNRPISLGGGSYLVQLVENAGAATNASYIIQEPALARQFLPYMFGPDANGTVFACGDPLRPGTLYFSKNYAPDSAPDTYNQEIVQPAEPLLGGEIIDGIPFVGSSERWWQLYPTPDNPSQRYSAVQIPTPRGLGAPFAHCTDGIEIFYWAKDGIYGTQRGSLTKDDLYNLFPHDGVAGSDVTYNNVTIRAPNYAFASQFRLAYANSYLYAIYTDSVGAQQMLVCDLRVMAWSLDQIGAPFAIFSAYHVEQPEQAAAATLNPSLLFGLGTTNGGNGLVAIQTPNTNDALGRVIACTIAVPEYDGGDQRAVKQWGDYFLDAVPAAATGITIGPLSLGQPVGTIGNMPQSSSRTRLPFNIGGTPVVTDFLGAMFSWLDSYSSQTTPTRLLSWHPTYNIQPASTVGFTTFGSSFALPGYMHIREVVIAYVSSTSVTLQFTSYDGQSPALLLLPSTGGKYQKTLFPLTANKGQLFSLAASSASPFQIFFEDSEVRVGGWGRTTPYQTFRDFGALVGGEGKAPDTGAV